ncbi:MAG: hypothetical protein LBC72_05810 [Spirochaetaceae bacterium]|nr:hypothetical protein [Spirochaetaceae bacterium]
MPTYEYECRGCGRHFELFQSMADEPVKVCSECGKEVRRLINGGGGVIFKGRGFYVTDSSGAHAKAEEPKKPAAAPPCASCPKAESGTCAEKAAG